jgi:hypothetical protein
MGNCCCCNIGIGPSPEELVDTIESIVDENYNKFLTQYKLGMKEKAPEPYVCEEVLDKAEKCGKRTLTEGVSSEEEVKKAAMEAAFAEEGKNEVKDQVWETIEPEMKDKANYCVGFLQAGALKMARRQSDSLVDNIWDKLRDRLADKMVQDHSETHAADETENVE